MGKLIKTARAPSIDTRASRVSFTTEPGPGPRIGRGSRVSRDRSTQAGVVQVPGRLAWALFLSLALRAAMPANASQGWSLPTGCPDDELAIGIVALAVAQKPPIPFGVPLPVGPS